MLHHFAASRPISHGIFVAICHWNCVKVLFIFQPTAEVDPIAQSNRSNRPSPVIRTSKAATQDDKVKNRSRQVPNFPITASNPKTRVKLFQNFRPTPPPARHASRLSHTDAKSRFRYPDVLGGAVNGREPVGRGTRARAHHTRAETRARDRIGKRPCRSRRTSSSRRSRRPKEVRVPSQMPVDLGTCVTAFSCEEKTLRSRSHGAGRTRDIARANAETNARRIRHVH